MAAVYLSTAYLAPVQYFCKLFSSDPVVIETAENYLKQTYRNRCMIATANGIQALSIPIEKSGNHKCLTKDIRISGHGQWRHVHWQALVSGYGTSPFFEYYQDDFIPFYEQKYDFLFEYNQHFMEMICKLLDMQPNILYTTQYETRVENDFREIIRPKHPVNDPSFLPQPYYQVFREKHGFIPNLSIVDLLFNMGPESLLVIRDSIRKKQMNDPV